MRIILSFSSTRQSRPRRGEELEGSSLGIRDRVRTQRRGRAHPNSGAPSLPSSPSFLPSFLVSCFSLHELSLLTLLICGTFARSLVQAWSPSHLIPKHSFLLRIQAASLIYIMCIVFIFRNLEKWVFPLLIRTQCFEILLHCYMHVMCVCVCVMGENLLCCRVLQGHSFSCYIILSSCHFVPLWFYDSQSWFTCSLSNKNHIPPPHPF